jgi:hypothetical protein
MQLQLRTALEASLGAKISKEIDDLLESMTILFDENFRQLRSNLDELEKNTVNSVKQ